MAITTEIQKHNGKIIIQRSSETGKPPKVSTYLTTRGGISWPTANSPFYFCILGLKDEPTLTEKNPLMLLFEDETPLMEKCFEKLAFWSRRLYCERLFADVGEENKSYKDHLYRFVRERGSKGIWLSDSSEFTNPEYSASLIRQWHHDNALEIRDDTILKRQIKAMKPEDLKKDESAFYAVAALMRVLISFEIYPWEKPERKGSSGIMNWRDHIRNTEEKWSGDYEELTIKL